MPLPECSSYPVFEKVKDSNYPNQGWIQRTLESDVESVRSSAGHGYLTHGLQSSWCDPDLVRNREEWCLRTPRSETSSEEEDDVGDQGLLAHIDKQTIASSALFWLRLQLPRNGWGLQYSQHTRTATQRVLTQIFETFRVSRWVVLLFLRAS